MKDGGMREGGREGGPFFSEGGLISAWLSVDRPKSTLRSNQQRTESAS